MARSFDGLAQRFRAAIERDQVTNEASALDRQRSAEQDEAARAALYRDLQALADALGVVTATPRPDGLVWSRGDREVVFASAAPGRVSVAWREIRQFHGELYREPALGLRWVLITGRPPLEERVPLLDAGVERLLVQGLGLPQPDEDPVDAEPEPPAAEEAEGPRASGRRL